MRIAARSAQLVPRPLKSRIIFAVVLLVAFAAFYFGTIRPAMWTEPKPDRPPIATRPTPGIPRSVIDRFERIVLPPIRIPEPAIVAIQMDQPVLKLEIPIQRIVPLDFPIVVPVLNLPDADQEARDRAAK